jgi:hypothetical protein
VERTEAPVYDYVELRRGTPIARVDILFVVDNSVSMGAAHGFTRVALPAMVNQLVNPPCMDRQGQFREGPGYGKDCPEETFRRSQPLHDVHIGVISSSLGGHGGSICSPSAAGFHPHQDDRARLIGSVRSGVKSYQNLGFLAWDPRGRESPQGEWNDRTLTADFTAMLDAVGSEGCGIEAPLEAWYRFLIDPEPPTTIARYTVETRAEGLDEELLAERARFLRPDSLLVIVMLTDEDDCSVIDRGAGWIMTSERLELPHGTSACEIDPNDPCCRPCRVFTADEALEERCGPRELDPACVEGQPLALAPDMGNLRCIQQKRRFGVDLLCPASRYVNGLGQYTVPDRAGNDVPNPLYTDLSGRNFWTRDPSLVFLGAIVGVPWQDIATDDSLSGESLTYLEPRELGYRDRWSVILGDPAHGIPPSDPHMIQSVEPRTGENPITGAALMPPDTLDPHANPINGHEQFAADPADPRRRLDELQYSCIYPLAEPYRCASGENDARCACAEENLWKNSPLCKDPVTLVAPGSLQYFAGAQPAPRILEVLRRRDYLSLLASFCPKITQGKTYDPSFGYTPLLEPVLERLRGSPYAGCQTRVLTLEPGTGRLPCRAFDVSREPTCRCGELRGRIPTPVSSEDSGMVRRLLTERGYCKESDCEEFCLCELEQLLTEDCLEDPDPPPSAAGYCYIDAEQGIGSAELVASCRTGEKRLIRFVGDDVPRGNGFVLLMCNTEDPADAGP